MVLRLQTSGNRADVPDPTGQTLDVTVEDAEQFLMEPIGILNGRQVARILFENGTRYPIRQVAGIERFEGMLLPTPIGLLPAQKGMMVAFVDRYPVMIRGDADQDRGTVLRMKADGGERFCLGYRDKGPGKLDQIFPTGIG